ncbi:MAG TPA: methionine--tRNA ligase [Arsenicitalea sp.]|jgi:methionyl-tRNA synthetase|nr:methionine--tRNA ligase [Arsenicitalea sp.]
MTSNPFYVTTAIAYPNGEPHIGHAYEMIATDAIARWKRLEGRDVFFLTGTDEHGIKMVQTAQAQGIPVRDLADNNSARFKKLAGALNISNDDFIRTTEPRHYAAAQELWRKMLANGDIYQDTYEGWYSVRDEAYFDASELTDGENGKKFAPSGAPVEWVKEPSFFFKLSAYQDKLLAFYDANPEFIGPKERRNEIVSFVKGGLQDLSVSRTTFDWGIPVPDQPGHVMYVWVDALTNYMTGVGYPDTESSTFKKYWPHTTHIIGKDIVRFHSVYWPAFLMSANLPLPQRVFAHGFLTVDGKKMSKSLGNVIDPFALIEEFGIDPVRFFFLREVSFGNDGDYSRDKIVNRSNADLANDFGNLAQRSLSMINKNCDGKVPEPREYADADKVLLEMAASALEKATVAMNGQLLHEAVGAIWEVVGEANRYFAAQEPWALKKTDFKRMETVLFVTAEIIRRMAIPSLAFIPEAAGRFLDFLAVPADQRLIAFANDSGKLTPGTVLPLPEPVFQRFERTKAE